MSSVGSLCEDACEECPCCVRETRPNPAQRSVGALRRLFDDHCKTQVLESYKVGWRVLCGTMKWLLDPSVCSRHLRKAIAIGEEALDFLYSQQSTESVAAHKVCLGIHVAESVASRQVGSPILVADSWEDVTWAFIGLLWNWKPSFHRTLTIPYTLNLKQWTVRLLNECKICPNLCLRLEMLRLIDMCWRKDLQNSPFGEQTASGLVTACSRLKLAHLLPDGKRPCLIEPFVRVLTALQDHEHLGSVAAATMQQVGALHVGPEARCLARLVELAGKMAKMAQDMHESDARDPSTTMILYENSFLLLRTMVATPPTMKAYESPGMAQLAATAFIASMSSLIDTLSTLAPECAMACQWLHGEVEYVINTLAANDKPQSVAAALRRDHGQTLADLSIRALDLQYSLYRLTQGNEESTEECPERFMDSVTQTVMEAPVMLASSNMVVDESTLMHLLLVSPKDPFTRQPLDQGSYTRLPDLRAEIDAWRNSRGGSHHTNRTSNSEFDISGTTYTEGVCEGSLDNIVNINDDNSSDSNDTDSNNCSSNSNQWEHQ
ncbi:uncharacterized protein [Panulirus ornatus]|uniref:uncharacterized protein n=1 Tax=Panulirus ornatus TaxID=150431 RepID=UPI003A873B7F